MKLFASKNRSGIVPSLENIQNTKFPKHRGSDWGSDFTMVVNPALCRMAPPIFPRRFSMFFAFLSFFAFSLRFGTTFGEGDRFFSSLAHCFLQSIVFVERNEARNREPQKSAVL